MGWSRRPDDFDAQVVELEARGPCDRLRAAAVMLHLPALPERLVCHDELERAADVGFERGARGFAVAARQGVDDLDMEVGAAAVAAVEALGGHAQIGAELQPQAFDDRQQHRRAGLPVDREVKGAVLLGAGFGDVLGVGFTLRGDELPQRVSVSAVMFAAARATARPSTAKRVSIRSCSASFDREGTRTLRFGSDSIARSAASRFSASRTGIALVPSALASSAIFSFCPGSKPPRISRSRSTP